MTVLDPATCTHATSEPVYAIEHPCRPAVGGLASILNGGRPVARICTDCHAQLHVGWDCPDCDWVDVELARRLCDPHDRTIRHLARPCQEHA